MECKLIYNKLTDKVDTSIICPFCNKPTFPHESGKVFGKKGWHCLWCNKFYFEKDHVFYYKTVRKEKLCKKTHLMPRFVLK